MDYPSAAFSNAWRRCSRTSGEARGVRASQPSGPRQGCSSRSPKRPRINTTKKMTIRPSAIPMTQPPILRAVTTLRPDKLRQHRKPLERTGRWVRPGNAGGQGWRWGAPARCGCNGARPSSDLLDTGPRVVRRLSALSGISSGGRLTHDPHKPQGSAPGAASRPLCRRRSTGVLGSVQG
jgi:hypothetical protein